MGLLAAEICARTGQDPGEFYGEVTRELGTSFYQRSDAPASPAQKALLGKFDAEQFTAKDLAGEPIDAKLTRAPGNDQPIGGIKVMAKSGWFAARPSGTEDIYKIYAESFLSEGSAFQGPTAADAIEGVQHSFEARRSLHAGAHERAVDLRATKEGRCIAGIDAAAKNDRGRGAEPGTEQLVEHAANGVVDRHGVAWLRLQIRACGADSPHRFVSDDHLGGIGSDGADLERLMERGELGSYNIDGRVASLLIERFADTENGDDRGRENGR
jgi:hypothetical protein